MLALINSLGPQEWAAPSGCAGWRVKDVVAHMGAVFRSICGDTSIPSDPSGDAEKSAELAVAPRKEWSAAEVAAEYREWAPKGLAALAALQEPPLADAVIPLGNLGSHPMHILGNAIVFDHYCHLRHDIGAALPRGDFVLAPADPLWTVTTGTLADAPTLTSSAHDFVSWGTKRADWRATSALSGLGAEAAAVVLDAINII